MGLNRSTIIAVIVTAGLAGCDPAVVVLSNLATGQVAQCKGDPQAWDPAGDTATCAREYVAAGYRPDSSNQTRPGRVMANLAKDESHCRQDVKDKAA